MIKKFSYKRYTLKIETTNLYVLKTITLLKKFNVEMLITPFRSGEGNIDCFYYDGEIKDCNEEILEKFDMQKYDPIEWKEIEEDDLPF